MTKKATAKIIKTKKIAVLDKAHQFVARHGKHELCARFNMYRVAIGLKPVSDSTIARYMSGYKDQPDGTNPIFAAYIKAVQ
jgi:hypothetical protein